MLNTRPLLRTGMSLPLIPLPTKPPYCRAPQTLFPKLGTNYSWYLDPPSCTGLPYGFVRGSCSGIPAQTNSSKQGKSGDFRVRSSETGNQKGNPSSSVKQYRKRFFKQPISCAQERGGTASGCQPKTTETNDALRTFQSGRDSYVEGSASARVLFSQNRPKIWLFNSPNLQKAANIHSLSLEGQHMGVCVLSLWSHAHPGCSQHLSGL